MAQHLAPRLEAPADLPVYSRLWRSRRRAALFAVGAGAAVFCTAFFTERYLHGIGAAAMPMVAASDALAGLLTALVTLILLYNSIDRRDAMLERLHAIAEINHHIRNALEMIQLSAQTGEDQRRMKIIREGVERIEWVLREIMAPCGPLGEPARGKTTTGGRAPVSVERRKRLG